jgi:hypothetical protein
MLFVLPSLMETILLASSGTCMHGYAIRSPLVSRGTESVLPKEHCPSAAEKKAGETSYGFGRCVNPTAEQRQSRRQTYGGFMV